MLSSHQNQIVYLMFLNGLLFLGLNFVAQAIVFPGGRGSKKLGYVLFTVVGLVLCITQELDLLLELGFQENPARVILLGGFATPVFLVSLVYYRMKKTRLEKTGPKTGVERDVHGNH